MKVDGVEVSIETAGDNTEVREEVSVEVIPESLRYIPGRVGLFVDKRDRYGIIGKGKESCSSVVLGLFKSRVRCSVNLSQKLSFR